MQVPERDVLDPVGQRLCVRAAGREWELARPADLETLWREMDAGDPDAENHIPYWVELWPATLALCDWLAVVAKELVGFRCLDLGCGLGLSALVARSLGAEVVGMDFEAEALRFARKNAAINAVPSPCWVRMDWNRPGFAPGAFRYIWGGDVLYEQRFFEPLEALLLRCLAPGGKVWFADPERAVSRGVWTRFVSRGWSVRGCGQQDVPFAQSRMTVNIWELRRA